MWMCVVIWPERPPLASSLASTPPPPRQDLAAGFLSLPSLPSSRSHSHLHIHKKWQSKLCGCCKTIQKTDRWTSRFVILIFVKCILNFFLTTERFDQDKREIKRENKIKMIWSVFLNMQTCSKAFLPIVFALYFDSTILEWYFSKSRTTHHA